MRKSDIDRHRNDTVERSSSASEQRTANIVREQANNYKTPSQETSDQTTRKQKRDTKSHIRYRELNSRLTGSHEKKANEVPDYYYRPEMSTPKNPEDAKKTAVTQSQENAVHSGGGVLVRNKNKDEIEYYSSAAFKRVVERDTILSRMTNKKKDLTTKQSEMLDAAWDETHAGPEPESSGSSDSGYTFRGNKYDRYGQKK